MSSYHNCLLTNDEYTGKVRDVQEPDIHPKRSTAMSLAARLHATLALTLLGAAGALQAQTTPPDLSDPEVAHVAVTANGIDSAAAKFALTRTHNDQVKAFANTMITDHTAVDQQA